MAKGNHKINKTGMTLSVKFEAVDDPEVIRFTHLQNGSTWSGEYLSREEYADREHILGQSELGQLHKSGDHIDRFEDNAKHLGIKYFVLKDLTLPETSKTSQIVASCETMNRVGWVMVPGSEEITPVLTACVGGVFTLKHHRGRGYAKKMIDQLNHMYDSLSESSDDPFLKYMTIDLYSEVDEYYSRNGFVSYHVPVYEIHQLAALETRYCDALGQANKSPVRTLGYNDYEDLVELQRQQFRKQMVEYNDGSKFLFTVKPTLETYMWFEDRDIFVSKKFHEEKPIRFGAALSDGSHIVWHHSWTSHSLYIIKVYIATGETQNADNALASLLKEAVKECHLTKLTYLEFWQDEIPPETFPVFYSTLRQVESGHNLSKVNHSLSAIRLSPSCQKYKDEYLWLNNTKYCWF